MKAFLIGLSMLAAVALAGCGDGGGAAPRVYCDYVGGVVTFTRNQTGPGDAQNVRHSADRKLSTFAFVGTELQQTFTLNDAAPSAVTYSDLPRAVGAFVTIVPGPADSITLNTYLDNVLQQSVADAALDRTPTQGKTAAEEYLSFTATQPFDEVEMIVSTSSGSEYSVYEFCADGDIF